MKILKLFPNKLDILSFSANSYTLDISTRPSHFHGALNKKSVPNRQTDRSTKRGSVDRLDSIPVRRLWNYVVRTEGLTFSQSIHGDSKLWYPNYQNWSRHFFESSFQRFLSTTYSIFQQTIVRSKLKAFHIKNSDNRLAKDSYTRFQPTLGPLKSNLRWTAQDGQITDNHGDQNQLENCPDSEAIDLEHFQTLS